MALLAYYFSLNVNIHEYKDLYREGKMLRNNFKRNEREELINEIMNP